MENEMLFDGRPFEEACYALAEETGRLLTALGAHAAVAESLTGGLIASEIVRVPGSSRWFSEGCVTYTNAAKMRRLNVNAQTLQVHTAVSAETAGEMAQGMLMTSGADIAVAATGLAGPGRDEFGREPGLVYIAGANANGYVVKRLALSGGRNDIRMASAYAALALLHALALGL